MAAKAILDCGLRRVRVHWAPERPHGGPEGLGPGREEGEIAGAEES